MTEHRLTDPAMQEFLTLLELTTNYMVAADAIIDGLQGKLGVDTRQERATEKAAAEIAKRVDAYQSARQALIKYARSREALLS